MAQMIIHVHSRMIHLDHGIEGHRVSGGVSTQHHSSDFLIEDE